MSCYFLQCIGLDESDHCLSLMDESGGQRDDLFLKPEVPGYDGLSLKDAQEAVNDGQEVLVGLTSSAYFL